MYNSSSHCGTKSVVSKFESKYSHVTFTRFGQQMSLHCKYFYVLILQFYKIISYLILLISYHFSALLPPQLIHHSSIRHVFAQNIRSTQKTHTVCAFFMFC